MSGDPQWLPLIGSPWCLHVNLRNTLWTMFVHVCTFSCSIVSNSFVTTWTIACLPDSCIHGIFQASITGMGCHFLLQGFSWPRDWIHISWIFCIGRWIIYHCATWESLRNISHSTSKDVNFLGHLIILIPIDTVGLVAEVEGQFWGRDTIFTWRDTWKNFHGQ